MPLHGRKGLPRASHLIAAQPMSQYFIFGRGGRSKQLANRADGLSRGTTAAIDAAE